MTESAKWKDSLLKSSLPLEHLVAESLSALGWEVSGQYSYARRNESGVDVDFSVDLSATTEYSSKTHWLACLELLIECKYASPGVSWIFLPYPPSTTLHSGLVKVFDQAANKRVTNRSALERLEESIPYCIRGISLFDSGFDENSIQRGASQLRFAMPRIAEFVYSSHARDIYDEDIAVQYACAILVTTAPLYCLKQGLQLEDVFEAKNISSIVEPVDELILWEWGAPDRSKYSHHLFEALLAKGLKERLQKYREVFVPSKEARFSPQESSVRHGITGSGDHVLVTTHARLPFLLKALERATRQSASSLHRIAEVARHQETGEAVIRGVTGASVVGKPNARRKAG